MNFNIETEQLGDEAYVISLAGEVDLYTAPEFKQQLLDVIGQGGKELFKQQCGSCHTLADAGTTGTVGPNLDNAFGGDRAQGFKESTFRQVVAKQIMYAEAPMPDNLVKGKDVDAVAAYVASTAGV